MRWVRRSGGPVIVAGSIASIDRVRRGQRRRRVGLHHRQRHLRRPATRRAVGRRPGPPRSSRRRPPMRPARPERRLGRVSGRTLLADRLRDELLDEITSSRSCRRGPSCRARANWPSASTYLVPRCGKRCAGLSRPATSASSSRFGQLCHRASADAARARRDAELPRDDRELRARVPGCASLQPAFEQCRQDDAPLQLGPRDTVLAVERVRTADDQPVIYSLDRIPAAASTCCAPTSICRTSTRRCSRC